MNEHPAPGPVDGTEESSSSTEDSAGMDEGFWMSDPAILSDIDQMAMKLRALGPAATSREAGLRLRWLEELAATIAATQAKAAVDLHAHRISEDAINNLPIREQGVCAGDEIALARRISPAAGRRYLTTARTLVDDLPHTFDALALGIIPDSRAKIVADATHDLTPDQRTDVDAQLAPALPELGNRQLSTHARALATEVTADTAADRAEAAAKDRHVRVRMGTDGMARISATLPAIQAIAIGRSLCQATASLTAAGDTEGRTDAQLMADLFVQRLTGQDDATAVPVEVHVVMDAESLFADGQVPAWLPGHGPVPASTAREHLINTDAAVFIRRLFTSPDTGELVGMESRARTFTGLLRRMVIFRDDVCRTPWCDAPIKHVDHATPVAAGGGTSWANASGLCASCNYVKEHPGWAHQATKGTLRVLTPSGGCVEADVLPLVRKFRPPARRGSPRKRVRPEWGSLSPPFRSTSKSESHGSGDESSGGQSSGDSRSDGGSSGSDPPGGASIDLERTDDLEQTGDRARTVNVNGRSEPTRPVRLTPIEAVFKQRILQHTG